MKKNNGNYSEKKIKLDNDISNYFDVISLCLSNDLRVPALVLICVGIDILATLNLPQNKVDVKRVDFINWCDLCDLYLIPVGLIKQCSSIDLYAARCSIVYSSIAELNLSRKGDAKEISYTWGNCQPNKDQSILDRNGIEKFVIIYINDLTKSFQIATEDFFKTIYHDTSLLPLFLERAGKMFSEYRNF